MATWKQKVRLILLVTLVGFGLPATAIAGGQSSSTNYQVNEVFIGSGGELHACGTQFCAKQSAGETAVGNTKSANFQANAGFNTDRTPYIQFVVNNTNIDLGTLTTTSTKTANATFSVKAYLAHGYSVINASGPPTNDSYTMQTLASPTASAAGTEQFGINLAANTSPTTFGADPAYIPDNTFSYGAVTPSYSAPNVYMYGLGDTIAFSNSSSSDTSFTISYIFNISHVTPGGTYTLHHVLVATGTY